LFGESLHPQNVSKVNAIVNFTTRTRTVGNVVSWKQKRVRDKVGSRPDKGRPKKNENDGIDTNNGFNEFKTDSEPYKRKDCKCRKVEQVIAEIIVLKSDSANACINVTLWFGRDGKLGTSFL
jgi:hypothetical protein